MRTWKGPLDKAYMTAVKEEYARRLAGIAEVEG
jgi:hypothetical protein